MSDKRGEIHVTAQLFSYAVPVIYSQALWKDLLKALIGMPVKAQMHAQ